MDRYGIEWIGSGLIPHNESRAVRVGTGWDMESIWFATHPLTTTPNDDFVEGAHVDTVVAGAGLTGLTTAVLLARSGQKVAVLEARRVGAVTTGHTTAKVSLLQGKVLSQIRRRYSDDVLRAYVEANREGQAWLLRLLQERGVAHQTRDAWTYAETEPAARQLQGELDACRAAGIDEATWTAESELPFPIAGAIRLPGQAQIHPLEALEALLAEFTAHGGILIEEARVTDASSKSPVTITTTRGRMTAERLILATGTPILDRGAYFARLTPQRSYVTTYRVPGPIPQGMHLSVDSPARSLRTVPGDGGEQLMVGGNGHVVGRSDGTSQALADLIAWTERHFSGAEHTHAWSAQDYRSVDRVPFVGPLPRGGGRIYVATGYNKWGMTNAVAAALNLSSQILEGQTRWADTLGHRRSGLAGAVDTVKANAEVGMEMTKNWVQAELRAVPDEAPAEGAGLVGRGEKGRPEAVSTVDGATCRVSGVCTHLGGILRWNDAERSWDCPLHGSRFAADGTLLEGPAVSDLPRLS